MIGLSVFECPRTRRRILNFHKSTGASDVLLIEIKFFNVA
jgi:hypothetical protein